MLGGFEPPERISDLTAHFSLVFSDVFRNIVAVYRAYSSGGRATGS